MLDYSEKRSFIRMPLNCPVRLQSRSGEASALEAELLDLSAAGVRFVSERAHDAGERLQITLRPENPITPPLEAEVSVIRCAEVEQGYDVAATIEMVAPAIYPEEA
jgi:hypothetical protein